MCPPLHPPPCPLLAHIGCSSPTFPTCPLLLPLQLAEGRLRPIEKSGSIPRLSARTPSRTPPYTTNAHCPASDPLSHWPTTSLAATTANPCQRGNGGGVLKRKQVLKLGSLNGAYFYLNFKRQDFSSGIDFQGIYQLSPHPPLAHRVKKRK